MLGCFFYYYYLSLFFFSFLLTRFFNPFLRIFAAAKVVSIYQKYTLTPFDEDENDVVADDDGKDDEIDDDDDGGKSVRERLIIMKFTMQVCSATDPKLLPMLFAVCAGCRYCCCYGYCFLLLLMELLMGKSRCCCCLLLCSLLAMAQRPLTRIHSDMQSVPAHKHNLPQSSVNRIKS